MIIEDDLILTLRKVRFSYHNVAEVLLFGILAQVDNLTRVLVPFEDKI